MNMSTHTVWALTRENRKNYPSLFSTLTHTLRPPARLPACSHIHRKNKKRNPAQTLCFFHHRTAAGCKRGAKCSFIHSEITTPLGTMPRGAEIPNKAEVRDHGVTLTS